MRMAVRLIGRNMMSNTIKGRDLKKLVADMDDDADVMITLNGDPNSNLLVYSAKKNVDGDLLLDTIHHCEDL